MCAVDCSGWSSGVQGNVAAAADLDRARAPRTPPSSSTPCGSAAGRSDGQRLAARHASPGASVVQSSAKRDSSAARAAVSTAGRCASIFAIHSRERHAEIGPAERRGAAAAELEEPAGRIRRPRRRGRVRLQAAALLALPPLVDVRRMILAAALMEIRVLGGGAVNTDGEQQGDRESPGTKRRHRPMPRAVSRSTARSAPSAPSVRRLPTTSRSRTPCP